MRRILGCVVALFISTFTFAQNEQDVLRYSRIGFGGTARFSAMGGAFGALGGDMSTMVTNPAGIGVYRKSEFSLTPSFFNQKVNSSYYDTTSGDVRFQTKFDGFGFVVATRPENRSDHGWQMMSMAINYTRTNAFQANLLMTGKAPSSLMDSWVRSADGTGYSSLDPFNEGLAWNTYMLDPASPGDTSHYVDAVPDGQPVDQLKTVNIRGGMGEWTFGLAGNYDNRFYIGGSVGIPTVNYEETVYYEETEVYDSVSTWRSFQFQQYLETKGRGIVARAGIIFRPTDYMRVGVAFTSPSSIKMTDSYFSKMNSQFDNAQHEWDSPNGNYRYKVITPMRITGSLAFIITKVALLSIDYEFVDYSNGKLKAPDYDFFDQNNAVRAKYQAASNIRAGLEVKMVPFSFRAGFAYYQSPYRPEINNEAARMYISGGIGYRDPDDAFFVDVALVSQRYTENYFFYDQSLVDPVVNEWRSVNVLLTVGLRFGDTPPQE